MSKELKTRPLKVNSPYALGHNDLRQLRDVQVIVPDVPEPVKEVVSSPSDEVFRQIFAINPRTKLPQDDLAVFMSENTSPEIRDFIARNLMSDNGAQTDGAKYDGLNDDVIAEYTRGKDESVQDYKSRMYGVVLSDYKARQALKNDKPE